MSIWKQWAKNDANGGILLMLAALFAMILANSSFASEFQQIFHNVLSLTVGQYTVATTLQHAINDGAMVLFFLLVGMEIKREMIEGHLASRKQSILPAIAAVGGVLMPALIFTFFNAGNAATQHGWAVASATDIAFVVGLLALFGRRLPVSLKVFITAIAVIDDLIAILIIALFYGEQVHPEYLVIVAMIFAILVAMNLTRVRSISMYMFFGFFLWLAAIYSGIHATIAGVLLGLTIPLHVEGKRGRALLKQCEADLHPLVSYIVLPLFAFANAGVPLAGFSIATLTESLSLGIIGGLFLGKQLGIFLATFLCIKSGIAALPHNARLRDLYGVCIIGGIGFTMSLFIGVLAFSDEVLQQQMRLAVMVGSVLSACVGAVFLHLVLPRAVPRITH
jgi:NhaA family Na+:H+ antiporter